MANERFGNNYSVIRRLIPKSNYARNVVTLITGTGLAQAIPIAISPILTRLYTPEDFGVFGLYLAIATILVVTVTGRYELAILLPKSDRDAINILALSILLSLIVSLVLLVFIFIFDTEISTLLNTPEISFWLYWIPLSTALMGVYQTLNYWSNRKSHYKRLAISRTFQSAATAATQLSIPSIISGVGGLVGGQLIGHTVSSIVLGKQVLSEDKNHLGKVSRVRMRLMARKYRKFPKFLILAHSFNTASSQVPVMLLTSFFSSSITGFYVLTQRVMGAPTTLVARAIQDVFRQEAAHAYIHKGECRQVYVNTLKKLLILSVLPSVVFLFAAPSLFALVFGESWRIAGEYAQILTPVFFLRFVTSPLSAMFMIAEKQKLDLIWQVVLFTLTVTSLILGKYFEDITLALSLFSLSYSIMFAVNGYVTYCMSKGCNRLSTH